MSYPAPPYNIYNILSRDFGILPYFCICSLQKKLFGGQKVSKFLAYIKKKQYLCSRYWIENPSVLYNHEKDTISFYPYSPCSMDICGRSVNQSAGVLCFRCYHSGTYVSDPRYQCRNNGCSRTLIYHRNFPSKIYIL